MKQTKMQQQEITLADDFTNEFHMMEHSSKGETFHRDQTVIK